ncbi:hypothetical protein [Nocardia noduli]|uniref:hypothetical protein n=1 Tax=Nocardia noduli TaxID=2815722 RepID=UPI001C2230B9|nr:hypothetical protein [Nocardia noduli]
MARERIVEVVVPIVPDSGGRGIGVVSSMAMWVAGVVLFALAVMAVVTLAFPPHDPSAPSPTRVIGDCSPFCPLSTTAGER